MANGAEWKTFKQWHATASLPFALTNQSPSYGNKHSPSNWGSRFSPPLSPASSNEAGSMEGVADSDERQPQEMAVEQVTTVGSKVGNCLSVHSSVCLCIHFSVCLSI